MNVVNIPESHQISENGKEYTVYTISIKVHGRTHEVKKRYSELFEIHKLLKKQVKVPQFPPKQIQSRSIKVIEARKAGLQSYFQWIVSNEPHCDLLLELLKIPIVPHSSLPEIQSIDSLDVDARDVSHRPVIYFKPEVMKSICLSSSQTQDNVVSGVFTALYC